MSHATDVIQHPELVAQRIRRSRGESGRRT